MIKVSVVIPVYKVEKYLPACLDSVLSQSLQEIEVICIDDASPDLCPEILDEYAARDSRVRVLHLSENHQQGYGRNRGLEMAEGKYVYLLDSDDMITPEAMEELYAIAEKDKLDGIFFDSQVIFESKEIERRNCTYPARRYGQYENCVYSGPALFELFMEQKDWVSYVQRMFWRKDYILKKQIFFLESTEHEDEFFAFKAILLAQRVRYISKDYFIRRYREDSVMTRPKHPKDFHGYFVTYCAMVDFLEETGYTGIGARDRVMHMHECMKRFFPLFSKEADASKWFKTEAELRAYRYYSYAKRLGESFYKNLIRQLSVPISKDDHVWIYGAGIVGERVYRVLIGNGFIVDGFLVTCKEGNPEVVLGREVFQVDQIRPEENRVAVVAVTGAARQEMQTTLERLGWRYSVYVTGGI